MKRMLPINDDFFAAFLMTATMSISFVLTVTLGFTVYSENIAFMMRGMSKFANPSPSPISGR